MIRVPVSRHLEDGLDVAVVQDLAGSMGVAVAELSDTLYLASRDFQTAIVPTRRLAWELYWSLVVEEYARRGRTRPDGRPRRSGRRHRGMVAWHSRHG